MGGALLYAHNLLRVACLQQALGNAFGEEAAWEEFSAFLRLEKGSPLSDLILNSFREKGVDLSHYILERKSILKQLQK